MHIEWCIQLLLIELTINFILSLLIQHTEKKIASRLKWDLNAITVADFIHELSERLFHILNSYQRSKLVEHSLTLANVCLICKLRDGL